MARFFRIVVVALLILAVLPAQALEGCKACVIGGDNKAYCKDPDVYLPTYTLYANCRTTSFCYYMPGVGTYCWPDCYGQLCVLA